MGTCTETGLSSSYAYKTKKCRCVVCVEYKAQSTKRHAKKQAEYSRQWRRDNPEKSRALAKEWAKRNPRKLRLMRAKQYGLSEEGLIALENKAANKCMICYQEASGFGNGKVLHIDHCHNSGKIRGLLCGSCNTGLGHFKDDINMLENAIKYLKENGDVY